MGSKNSAPPAPDYRGAAEAQGASSKENIAAQTWANRPTLNTPWGQQTWQAGQTVDPATGQPVTNWTSNINLSDSQQQALDSQMRIQQERSNTAEGMLGRVNEAVSNPFDYSGAPEAGNIEGYDPQGARNRSEQALFQRQMNLIEPGLTQSEDARRTRMANMGISPEGGSTPWARAEESMQGARQQATSQAALSAIAGGGGEAQRELGMATGAADAQNRYRQQWIAEEAQRRNVSLNEMNAMLTGQQVQSPQMPNFNPAGSAQPTQYLPAAAAQGQYGMDAAQMGANETSSMFGGLGQLAGTAGMFAMSDRRLKSDIEEVGTHSEGVGVYEYTIFGRRERGVMAQELLEVRPDLVAVHPSGYLMVNYGGL